MVTLTRFDIGPVNVNVWNTTPSGADAPGAISFTASRGFEHPQSALTSFTWSTASPSFRIVNSVVRSCSWRTTPQSWVSRSKATLGRAGAPGAFAAGTPPPSPPSPPGPVGGGSPAEDSGPRMPSSAAPHATAIAARRRIGGGRGRIGTRGF